MVVELVVGEGGLGEEKTIMELGQRRPTKVLCESSESRVWVADRRVVCRVKAV